jgi:hypothetical protein
MRQIGFTSTLIVAVLFAIGACAQMPVPILSYATQRQTPEWYLQQIQLWKAELNKDTKNSLAWYNYYRATRNYYRTVPSEQDQAQYHATHLRQIVDSAGSYAAESFEYNLLMWLDHGNDPSYLSYLEKAAKLGPDRDEIISDMIGYGELRRDVQLRDKYSLRWLTSLQSSPGLLRYHSNLLESLDQNAIIFTTGDNDTYPIWQLQAIGMRRDVLVLNLYLLQIQPYQNRILEELGINRKDLKISIADSADMRKALVREIARLCTTRPVYIGLTVDEDVRTVLGKSAVLTGLAYQYSTSKTKLEGKMRQNYETIFAMNYLQENDTYDISQYATDCINQNYLVMLLAMYNKYKADGNVERMKKADALVRVIAEKSTDKEAILKWLQE